MSACGVPRSLARSLPDGVLLVSALPRPTTESSVTGGTTSLTVGNATTHVSDLGDSRDAGPSVVRDDRRPFADDLCRSADRTGMDLQRPSGLSLGRLPMPRHSASRGSQCSGERSKWGVPVLLACARPVSRHLRTRKAYVPCKY